jgi:hypothetical protein
MRYRFLTSTVALAAVTAVAAFAPVLAAGQAATGEAKVKGGTRTKTARARPTCREHGISQP